MLEKRGYFVAVKAPNWGRFILKYQQATSLEKAQELVKGYCDYWRKKKNLISEEAYRVIYHPMQLSIAYTFNVRDVDIQELRSIHAFLTAFKSSVIYTDYVAETDDSDVQRQHYSLYVDAELYGCSVKDILCSYFTNKQRENVIIDYSVQVRKYEYHELYSAFPAVKNFRNYEYLTRF